MGKITRDETATWIRALIPYLENPVMLSPKHCVRDRHFREY